MRRRSKFDEKRDEHIAADFERDKVLMCSAPGCPCPWSIDFGRGRYCRWHGGRDPHEWPAITEELNRHITDTARQRAFDDGQIKPALLTRQERPAIVARMRAAAGNMMRSDGGIDLRWAHALREREMSGERLSTVQRDAWRSALEGKAIDRDEQLRREELKRETQRRIDERLEKTA
jgi:hypothetical protein